MYNMLCVCRTVLLKFLGFLRQYYRSWNYAIPFSTGKLHACVPFLDPGEKPFFDIHHTLLSSFCFCCLKVSFSTSLIYIYWPHMILWFYSYSFELLLLSGLQYPSSRQRVENPLKSMIYCCLKNLHFCVPD